MVQPVGVVSMCIRMRRQRGCMPAMSSSRAHIRGTSPKPISRAAWAGNMQWTSSVAVNTTEMMSSCSTALAPIMARSKAWVLSVTCGTVSSSTVVAPRSARTRRAGRE